MADNDELLESIRQHKEEGVELTDEELDVIADTAIECVRSILSFFGETNIVIDEYEGEEGELILDVNEGDLAVLIGRHGRTLESLQTLVSSLVNNQLGFHHPVVIDIEGYKSRRRQKIQSMARNAAARAKREHSQAKLPPMNAYERRIAHMTLSSDPDVTTHSEGEEPDRHLVITSLV